jgi:CNT family concentrative nucleoside transporter
MAAPGGLLMAKLIVPETEQPGTHVSSLGDSESNAAEEKPVNIFDAIADGSLIGLRVALNVGALLLAFVALIAMLNGLIGMVGEWFGYQDITLQLILGYLFAPLAFLIGVPWEEASIAGSLIGQKFVINEFFAYVEFTAIKDTLSAHTQAIITFALCGFANLASIAILMGGLGALVPSRRADVARLGLKAVLAGTLVNLTNAVLASFFLALS